MSKISLCPASPNCVCTLENETAKKRMPTLRYVGEIQTARQRMKDLVLALGNAKLQEEAENYLHFTFKTRLGGFIDDVEFEFAEREKVIHFRSASRVGYSDMGANKRRMRKISRLWSTIGR